MNQFAKVAVVAVSLAGTFAYGQVAVTVPEENEIVKTVTTCDKFDDQAFKADANDLINIGNPALKEVINENFVQFQSASVTAFNDGKLGSNLIALNEVTCDIDGVFTTTFVLSKDNSPKGYNIQKINLFSGWQQPRSSQKFVLSYATVDKPDVFISLGEFVHGETKSTLVCMSLARKKGLIAENVIAVRVAFAAYSGGAETTWREIDVIGTAAK
jgi:hypothetical protein